MINISFRLELGRRFYVVYPVRTPKFYIDISRHGLICIGRLWIDW